MSAPERRARGGWLGPLARVRMPFRVGDGCAGGYGRPPARRRLERASNCRAGTDAACGRSLDRRVLDLGRGLRARPRAGCRRSFRRPLRGPRIAVRARGAEDAGQAAILLVSGLAAVLLGAFVLGAVARGVDRRANLQRAADLAALAGARALLERYDGLFAPPVFGDGPNPRHVTKATYLTAGRTAATATARANTALDALEVSFPDEATMAPVRIRVRVVGDVRVGRRPDRLALAAVAEAELAPPAAMPAVGGGYSGPFAFRQGKPMRPDVALAFDRLAAAARADGIALVVVSAYRSDAEQAVLWRKNPDPRWVAPPGKSLHRLGTELDLGPPSAYGWLARHAPRFHFVRRYSWEPWHFGYALNARSRPAPAGDGERGAALPSFVPAAYVPALASAAQRFNVSAALLAAQIYVESGFNPFAVSAAGAQGIAQFMPATARAVGLRNPFDAQAAIAAQARLMRDLLRRFGTVPLALAAYNAGPAAVARCVCIPPIPETRGYVARILGLLGGAGEVLGGGLEVRLVR